MEEAFVVYQLCCAVRFYLTSSVGVQTAPRKGGNTQTNSRHEPLVQMSLLNKPREFSHQQPSYRACTFPVLLAFSLATVVHQLAPQVVPTSLSLEHRLFYEDAWMNFAFIMIKNDSIYFYRAICCQTFTAPYNKCKNMSHSFTNTHNHTPCIFICIHTTLI